MSTFWLEHQWGLVVFLAFLLLIAFSNGLTLRRLSSRSVPQHLPTVSILVPVRNEQAVIADCLRSLLAQDYPHFQVLVLDDGSTDDTRRILEHLAQTDERLQIFSGASLPEGWLGKSWACHQLAQVATGELFLFTDADTTHHPHALRAGVAALLAENADLVTGFLYQRMSTWGERLTVPTIFWCFFVFLPLALAYRLRLPILSLTNGQWMLFRRTAYQTIGGHAAVRSSPIDDIALGRRIKASGLRWRVVDASDYVTCRMYSNLTDAVKGFSKNLFAVFEFRLLPYIFVWTWIALLVLEPPVVIALWLGGIARSLFDVNIALLAVSEMLALWGLTLVRLRFPLYLLFLYPVHFTLLVFIAWRSLVLTITGRITWKGRRLPRQRVRIV